MYKTHILHTKMTRINWAVIYVIYFYLGYESYVAFGRKRQKIQDDRQQTF